MMGRSGKQYDDDDGRTIVDMSQVEPSYAFRTRRPDDGAGDVQGRARELMNGQSRRLQDSEGRLQQKSRPWEDSSLSFKERVMCAMGALKAALLIGFAYLAGFAVLIWLLMRLWN